MKPSSLPPKKGTSIIFINQRREVLLVLRDDKKSIPFPNCWDIPGGHVEENETPEATICREMREEINRDIAKPNLFHVYDMPDRIEHTFWLPADWNIEEIQLSEGQELRWFLESEVAKMDDSTIAFGFHKVLMDFFRERPFEKQSG